MVFRSFIRLTSFFIIALLFSCGGSGSDGSYWTGTKLLGVEGASTSAHSVATDASGNVYVSGSTGGDLDGNTLTGSQDSFVTKYDSDGIKQYTRQFGVAGGSSCGFSVATDTNSDVYVAGEIPEVDGGSGLMTGFINSYATKYDTNGAFQYTNQVGPTHWGGAVAIDANDNVYVAGFTFRDLDGNTLTGLSDFFVTKYDSNGVKLYTRLLGVTGASTWSYMIGGQSVATDTAGNVYIAGSTDGDLDGNSRAGTRDSFVAKYDSSGAKQFTKQFGVSGVPTDVASVATDVDGNVYVVGVTEGGLDGNVRIGSTDSYLVKYDRAGVKQFTKQFGVSGASTTALSVTADVNGNVYVAGQTNGDLDGNTLAGVSDGFVMKYDSNGVKQYTQLLGEAGAFTTASSVTTDMNGNVFVVGGTSGNLDGNTLTGSFDFFVTKHDSSGVKQ